MLLGAKRSSSRGRREHTVDAVQKYYYYNNRWRGYLPLPFFVVGSSDIFSPFFLFKLLRILYYIRCTKKKERDHRGFNQGFSWTSRVWGGGLNKYAIKYNNGYTIKVGGQSLGTMYTTRSYSTSFGRGAPRDRPSVQRYCILN